jgi:predicted Zn-dependent protease with MMP-like domain
MTRIPQEEFIQLVEKALRSLPKEFRDALENIDVVVEDRVPRELRRELGLKSNDLLFGLYQGIPLPQRSVYAPGLMPDKITIFQHDIETVCATAEQIQNQVYKTVLHEIGHYFGLDEDRLHELGYG